MQRFTAAARAARSTRRVAEQGADDQAVKRQDDREIGPAEPVVRQHQRGRRDLLARSGSSNVDHHAKIQVGIVKTRDQPLRSLAQNRE